jgi:hypothetical protein
MQQASHPRRASMPRPCRPAAAPRSRARLADRTTAQARAPRAPRPNPAHAAPRPDDGRLLKPTHRVARVSTLERAGRAPHYPSIRAVAVQPSSRSPRGLARCPHALHPLWQAGMEPFLARSGGSEASEASRAGGGCGVSLPASPAAELRRKQVRATSAAPRAPRSPPLARPGHGPPRAARAPAPSCGAA